jgi:hypothetical protein
VPDKQTGKKHGKGTMKAGDGFASVAYDSHRKQLVPRFTNRKDVGCATKTVRRMLGEFINVDHVKDKSLFYLLLAGSGGEPVAAGGGSMAPARANASIAIFQFPLSRLRILNQLP